MLVQSTLAAPTCSISCEIVILQYTTVEVSLAPSYCYSIYMFPASVCTSAYSYQFSCCGLTTTVATIMDVMMFVNALTELQ